MTVKEAKRILNKADDKALICVIQRVKEGTMRYPIESLKYDEFWNSWNFEIQ